MSPPLIGVTGRADRSARPPNLTLVSVAQAYAEAVALGGGAPLIIPPHLQEDGLRTVFERIDGLILSGGGDVLPALFGQEDSGLLRQVDERRDRSELALARWALEEELPILAICRGIQVLNVATGGSLIQDISTQVPDPLPHAIVAGRSLNAIVHSIEVEPHSRLAALIGAGEMRVTSAHHQAVEDVGAGLVVTARAPDGVVEGLELAGHPFCIGVQWHPEVMAQDHAAMRSLFAGLVAAAEGE